jgi:AraC family transcriptional regulator of adaptative response/methylated-DNA-[protein]-cysteine methyltransferase
MSDDASWSAVAERDPAADGAFYYAVTTTGIYCRPTCPTRQPRREHVRYFASPGDAEGAGFRACRRCDPGGLGPPARRAAVVARACRVIDEAGAAADLAGIAAEVGYSPFHLHRLFKSETGITPKAYLDARRAGHVRAGLAARQAVTEAVVAAGFASSGRFYASSSARLGMTPSTFRAGGRGLSLRYAVQPCRLGLVLVAVTDHGVGAVDVGLAAGDLVADLRHRFHSAVVVEDDEVTGRVAPLLVDVDDGRGQQPAAVRRTAFQERLWQALQRVPAPT